MTLEQSVEGVLTQVSCFSLVDCSSPEERICGVILLAAGIIIEGTRLV